MQLHRTGGRPDWADIPPKERNFWQRLAAGSHGIVTPGNVITLLGLLAVANGIRLIAVSAFVVGLAWIIGGRLADLLDGMAAEKTGTKSPLGEALDATCDKLGTIGTLIVVVTSGIVPWQLAAALLLPHLVIAGISLQAKRQGRAPHPSRLGKLSMAMLWFTIFLFVLWQIPVPAFNSNSPGQGGWLVIFSWLCAGAALAGSYLAMAGYIRANLRRAD